VDPLDESREDLEPAKIGEEVKQKAKEIYDREMYDEEDFEEHTFNKMPQDVQIIMEGATSKAKIYNLMGLTRDQYLKFGDVYRFLASHGFVR